MDVDIFWDHENAPTELRRAVTGFKPGVDEVRVAGVRSHRVIMAVETAELRKSGYDKVKTQAEWLYFEPRGARQFAALLMDMADAAEAAAGEPETTGNVHGTGDAPFIVGEYAVESGSQEIDGDPEPMPVVHLHLRAMSPPTAGLPDPPISEFNFIIPSEYAGELSAAIGEAADGGSGAAGSVDH